MSQDMQKETPNTALIKSNLERAFDEQAKKELPTDLIALLAKLHEQDLEDTK